MHKGDREEKKNEKEKREEKKRRGCIYLFVAYSAIYSRVEMG
jgi:hypothetical protein